MEFLLMLLLIFLFVLAIIAGLFWLIYKLFKKLNLAWMGLIIIAGITLSLIYNIYTAIYPNDNFYFEEFKTVTSLDIPSSAKVLSRSASYPDFHGDYYSASVIQLSANDYIKLLKTLKSDKRLTKGEIIGSEEFTEVMRERKETNIINSFQNGQNYQNWHYIGFFNDQRTIVVLVCKS